jgi:hypothetical protein
MLAGSVEFPDSAASPATSWTPESQIANLLELCGAQMESAVHDSDQAVEVLCKVFAGVAATSRALNELSAKLPPEARSAITEAMDRQLEELAKQVGDVVVSFQFYDKLSQRLGHVRYSLSSLAQFVCDRAQSSEQDQWRRMLNALRRLYRTEEERHIFQMMTGPTATEETMTTPMLRADAPGEAARTGSIELF